MRAQAESLRQLVFAGCGAKGMGYLGAVRALEETALLGGVERVAGTSSGALMAACLAVGATAEDLAEVVNPKELGQQLSRVPGLWELVQSPWRFGLRTSEPTAPSSSTGRCRGTTRSSCSRVTPGRHWIPWCAAASSAPPRPGPRSAS